MEASASTPPLPRSESAANGDGSPAAPATAAAPEATRTFGRLERAKVRDYWVDEARDFTPWLAREENLALLGDTIDLSLELIGVEQRVGPFKADIVATDGEQTVVIENQLDATDHRHLGQLLVYAAGRNAKTVVWVAKQVTDEYRKVIDWLNDETSVNFWALEIELWRIGDSPVAPKFNVVCEPNELTKASEVETAELSNTKLLQLEFWKGFSDYLETSGSSFNPRTARAQHWYDLPIGTTRAHIYLNALVAGAGGLECGLYVKTSQSALIFQKLSEDRESIEAQLGLDDEVVWNPNPDRLACRIGVSRPANLADRDAWPDYYEWLKNASERFKTAFSSRVREMELPNVEARTIAEAGAGQRTLPEPSALSAAAPEP